MLNKLDYAHRKNIERFMGLIATADSEEERQRFQKLLKDELASAQRDGPPGPASSPTAGPR